MLDEIATLPVYERFEMMRRSLGVLNTIDTSVRALKYDGCLVQEFYSGVKNYESDFCVYLWKHCWGEPFYVGSGKGDRWKSLSSRCDEFYRHIDKADAAVCRVVSGVDQKTARKYEKYTSLLLSVAGYSLVNRDNVIREHMTIEKARAFLDECNDSDDGMIPKINSELVKIVGSVQRGCDYRVTESFLREYGNDYFSRTHSKRYKMQEA